MSKIQLATLISALLFAASVPADGKPASENSKPKSTPLEANCESPRNAIYNLLYWLQEDRHNPGMAALCLSKAGLKRPAIDAPQLAEKLKKILDSRGLYVILDSIPADAEHVSDGEARYELFPDELGGIVWARDEASKWMLTPTACERIPSLYSETFPLGVDDLVQAFPSWLRGRIIGIQAWQLLGIFLLILLAVALSKLANFILKTYIQRFVERVDINWLEDVLDRSGRPIGGLVMAGVLSLGFPLLQFSVRVNQIALLTARVLAAFSLVWLGYRVVDVISQILSAKAEKTESKLDDQLIPLMRKTLKLFIAVIGGIFILQNLNVNVGSLLAGLGLGGLAFALAAKDTVANFFGSVMIFIDKPFQIGDSVQIGSFEGTVEEVGFRTTRIRTYYDSVITFPNARVTDSAVDNLGLRRFRRYSTKLGLTYDTPAEKVQSFCEGVRKIIQDLDGMRKDSYYCEFESFGDSALVILLYCFMEVPGRAQELQVRTRLNIEIMRLAESLGVEFAFPTQTLHVESLPTTQLAS